MQTTQTTRPAPTSINEARLAGTIREVRATGAIETSGAGTTVSGEQGIALFRFITLLSGLRLEVRTAGKLKLSRGPSCYTIAKREFQLKGTREAVLEQLQALYDRAKANAEKGSI